MILKGNEKRHLREDEMDHRKYKTIIMTFTAFLCLFMLVVSYAADKSSSKKGAGQYR